MTHDQAENHASVDAALAEAERRYRAAKCAHIMCDEPAFQDGGCLARGIPLCAAHASLVPGMFELDAIRAEGEQAERARCAEYLRRQMSLMHETIALLEADTTPVRTADQERGDVVAYLRRGPDLDERSDAVDARYDAADAIEAGTHERGER